MMTPQPDNMAGGVSGRPEEKGRCDFTLPQLDFSTFIVSLNSAALVHLGLIEEPTTQQQLKNLPLAKQTIDVLALLEQKTRGNLTPEESRMLKSMLYDLRVNYVKEG